MDKKHLWIWFLAVVLIVGVFLYLKSMDGQDRPLDENNDGIACTMEAKMCPDGSYVGRTGPNCEFSPCPN